MKAPRRDSKIVGGGHRPPPVYDSRLIGTWKSDSRRTLKEWRWRKPVSRRVRARFRKLFGKAVLRYTRGRVHVLLGKFQSVQPYRVLGRDEDSVAILLAGPMKIRRTRHSDPEFVRLAEECGGVPQIQHIRFDKNSYWIAFGGNREFFRRLRPPLNKR